MSNHPRIDLARKNSLARRLSAVLAAILLCESVKAQQTDQVQTDQVQMDEVMVSAQKQTALDSEAISLSATPDAEPHLEKGTSILLGLGVLESPVYDGAKNSKASPFPYVDIHGWFHDRVYVSSVRGLGVNIVDDGPFRAGLALNYRGGRTSSDSDRLKGLPDIKGSPSIRGFVTYSLKPLTFELSVKNEFGSNPSTEVSFGTALGFVPTPRLHLSIGADLSWVDSRFTRKYFGVTPAEAAQATAEGNPLTAYTPGSGLSTVGMTATGVYALTRHWGIISRLGLSELVGSPAKDSPLTQKDLGVSFGIGAAYKF
jgi:outer membrane scaffolding protein for murein synthesis (MipA/OmpV family)